MVAFTLAVALGLVLTFSGGECDLERDAAAEAAGAAVEATCSMSRRARAVPSTISVVSLTFPFLL